MFEWWRKRKEKKRAKKELMERYPLTTDDPYKAVIWKMARKMAAHLKRYSVTVRPEETLRQYHYKASRLTGIDVGSLYKYLYLLEGSMYSHHDMGVDHQDMAIDYLRDIERSIDSIGLPRKDEGPRLADPEPVPNQPVVMSPPAGDNLLSKKRFPENEGMRSTRPADLRRLRSRFDATGTDSFAPMDNEMVKAFFELVSDQRFGELRELILENSAAYMSSVHLSEMTGFYIMELHYRIREVLALDEPDMDGLLGLVVPGAKVLAATESRDFLIPDDIKVSMLTFLPGYEMRTAEDARNIVDSVQVPSPLLAEAEPDMDLS
ncbi:MAG: hypothetical protein R6V01_08640 [Thermoplasmatota archaeon]